MNAKGLLLALAVGLLALVVGACGSSDDRNVTVVGHEYSFSNLPKTLTPGKHTITFRNGGKDDHELIVARLAPGVTLQQALAAQGRKGTATILGSLQARPGQTASTKVTANFTRGRYAFVCPIETKMSGGKPHAMLGMQGVVTVN